MIGSLYIARTCVTGNVEAGNTIENLDRSWPTSAIASELSRWHWSEMCTTAHLKLDSFPPGVDMESIDGHVHRTKFSDAVSRQGSKIWTIFIEQRHQRLSLLQSNRTRLSRISVLLMMHGHYPSCWRRHTRLCTVSGYAIMHLSIQMSLIHWWAEFERAEQQSQIMPQPWMGTIISPELSTVASRFNSQLRLSLVTICTVLGNWIGLLWGQTAICAKSILLCQRSGQKLINCQWVHMDVRIPWHTRRVLGWQSR